MITLDYGKTDPNEILEISKKETILIACLGKIEQNKINELPKDIIENKKTGLKN